MLSMLRWRVSPTVAPLYASTSRWTSRPLTWTGFSCARRDLFALDHQELVLGAVDGVEAVHAREEIVIGQHQELVSVAAIPADHFIRCAVAAVVDRVRVRIALVPVHRDGGDWAACAASAAASGDLPPSTAGCRC